MLNPGTDTITVLRSPAPDRHGDPAGEPVATDVSGCDVQPRGARGSASSTELDGQRTTVSTDLLVFAPAGTPILPEGDAIRATDRVRWRSRVYEIEGEPADWGEHLEIILRIVRG